MVSNYIIESYKLWEDSRSDYRYYHFSKNSSIEIGQIIYSNYVTNRDYTEYVAPCYVKVAKENGLDFPISHGYAHRIKNGDPIFSRNSGYLTHAAAFDIRGEERAKLLSAYKIEDGIYGYEVIPGSDILSGAQSRSPQLCTMKMRGMISDQKDKFAEQYSKDYIEVQTGWDQRDREWICKDFKVARKLDIDEWTLMDMLSDI